MISVSFVAKNDSVPLDLRLDENYPRGEWEAARKQFTAPHADPGNFLSMFKSSIGRRRYFCSRCGTRFGYNIHPTPEDLPSGVEFVDLILGTVDRENLEGDHLSPERQAWWDVGIPWVQKQSVEGLGVGVPIHPGAYVDKIVKYQQAVSRTLWSWWGK